MSTSVISIELPEPLLSDAAELAEKSGMSVAAWISRTVEQRLCDEKLTADFYRRLALGRDAEALMAILDKAPDTTPIPGDEL